MATTGLNNSNAGGLSAIDLTRLPNIDFIAPADYEIILAQLLANVNQ